MDPSTQHTHTRIATERLPEVEADGLIVGLFEGWKPDADAADPLATAIGRVIALADFGGKQNQVSVIYPPDLRVPRVVLVGLGKEAEFTTERARKAAGTGAARLRDLGAKRIAISPPGAPERLSWAEAAGCAVEGALLGLYALHEFRTEKRDEIKSVDEISVVVPEAEAAAAAATIAEARAIAESVVWVRTLVGLPGNALTARRFADEATLMAKDRGIKCTILDNADLEALGMGCLLGVNSGSEHPAHLIVLEYDGIADGQPIAIVGKGITFDTGGLCLKPRVGMEAMKDDMAGGGAVLGTLRAAADLALPVRLVGVVATTDNMPGSAAVKPGDVLHSFKGLSVEVVDTDAEGRLVLADALAYAVQQFSPRAVIDLATLTGSVFVALGHHATGVFSTSDELAAAIMAAGETTGERCWRLPLWPEHDDLIKSAIADVRNQGEKGDSDGIAAAVFLKRFVGDVPWVHLDIAGTAWADKRLPYVPKGATGVGVRLLVEALRRGL